MLKNQRDFFENEYKKYEQILREYDDNNPKVFVDENFHPSKHIDETGLKINLYSPLITWKRIDEVYPAPLFQESKIHPLYLSQGELGDCYFIAALSRIAKQSYLVQTLFEKELPDKILGEVTDSINIKCGAVVIYFRVFGRRTPVLIDTLIPFYRSEPIFCCPSNPYKSAWCCLVEKAYAKLNGSYSNIEGGYLYESIYSLFGYYSTNFKLTDCNEKNKLKILKYQKNGCLMSPSIITDDQQHIDEAEKHDLVTRHAYLLSKIRTYKGILFFQLYNPWGTKPYKGDYSIDSDLWTPELRKVLYEEPKNGRFWMVDKDFFKYFTVLRVSKPVDPHWVMRSFSFKPPPLKEITDNDFNKQRSFAFQLIEEIPEGKKARIRILVEKRNADYNKASPSKSKLALFVGRNGGKKLKNYDFFDVSDFLSTISTRIKGINDIITFTMFHLTPKDIETNYYVNIFCEYDFRLYDIDNPENLFPRGEKPITVFDNFSISAPNAALILKNTIINGIEVPCLKNPTISDFDKKMKDKNKSVVIKSLIKQRNTSHYSFHGTQINLNNFIFTGDIIKEGNTSKIYAVTEIISRKEYAAIVSNETIDIVYKSFSLKNSIMMQLKYPSIICFIGFSETNFLNQPYPLIITEFCPLGTLSSSLAKMDNTKKMINLIGIAFGMKYIHKHNIILRDLMCSNILLDQNMYPKISHFSSARIADQELDFFGIDGPYYFIAPELIESSKPYSFSADVFAYGMLFYHVISNKEPTVNHTHKVDFYLKIINGELPSLDGIIPLKYHEFIKAMWNKNAEQRPTFDDILKKLLNERNEYWLDGVNEEEVERYIHQFDAT